MYKLILVDDEEEVRSGIMKRIDWEKYGFEVIGEAGNGLEALEFAEMMLPDVVITDIKMPFMDGLALSEKLGERFPGTRIIILTGFEEFEYAQRAIKLNVVEYVLKPVSSKELIEILLSVREKLDMEMAQKRDMEVLKEYYKKSLPSLKEKFLSALITNKMEESDILKKAGSYGLKLNGSGYAVSVINIDLNNSFKIKDMSENSDLYIYKNKELMNFAILNLAQEIVNKYNFGITFLNSDYVVILFISKGSSEPACAKEYIDRSIDNSASGLSEKVSFSLIETETTPVDQRAFMEKILLILQEINQYVKKYYKLALTMGVGNFTRKLTGISDSCENAITALNYRIIPGSNDIICIDDMEPENDKGVVFDELKERSLINSIKIGTKEEITETIEELFKELGNGRVSYNDYQIYLMEILTTVLKIARDLKADKDMIFKSSYNLFMEMYNFKELMEVKEWITGICIRIKAYVSQERFDTARLFVKRAREYVENNYNDYDITIDKVCRYLHISPTYFSTIFKRETKMTFVSYLTQVRMEAAKELLRSTGIKTLEIAKRVGYFEPNYFSYCFKKIFDISPSEYRKVFKSAEGG